MYYLASTQPYIQNKYAEILDFTDIDMDTIPIELLKAQNQV
jgi:hypothetical protein